MQALCSLGFFVICTSSFIFAGEPQDNEAIEISDVLERTAMFFEEWQSVSLVREGEKIRTLPESDAWVVGGREIDRLAWDGDLTHVFHRSVWHPWRFPDRRFADGRETLNVDGNSLNVSFKFATPTVNELASPDFTKLDVNKSDLVHDLTCTWADQQAGIDENAKFHAGKIELLTGRFLSPAWGDANVLTYFTDRKDIDLQPVVMLNRKCWKISVRSVNGMGSCSLSVCPELNFAPVEFEVALGKNDRFPNGNPVRNATKKGSHRIAFRILRRLEEVDAGMTEFTMRVQDWSENEDGTSMGFGGVYRFGDVVRPAPEDAFRLHVPIPDGTRVFLTNNSQIRGEWRDGKVVRVYDGEAVRELATVELVSAPTSLWKKGITIGLVMIGVFWGWKKWRGTHSSRAGGK